MFKNQNGFLSVRLTEPEGGGGARLYKLISVPQPGTYGQGWSPQKRVNRDKWDQQQNCTHINHFRYYAVCMACYVYKLNLGGQNNYSGGANSVCSPTEF